MMLAPMPRRVNLSARIPGQRGRIGRHGFAGHQKAPNMRACILILVVLFSFPAKAVSLNPHGTHYFAYDFSDDAPPPYLWAQVYLDGPVGLLENLSATLQDTTDTLPSWQSYLGGGGHTVSNGWHRRLWTPVTSAVGYMVVRSSGPTIELTSVRLRFFTEDCYWTTCPQTPMKHLRFVRTDMPDPSLVPLPAGAPLLLGALALFGGIRAARRRSSRG